VKKVTAFAIFFFSTLLLNGCYTQLMLDSEDQYFEAYSSQQNDNASEAAITTVLYAWPYNEYYGGSWWVSPASAAGGTAGRATGSIKNTRPTNGAANTLENPSREMPVRGTLPTASGAGSGSAAGSGSGSSPAVAPRAQETNSTKSNDASSSSRNDNGKRAVNKEKK
jgi:hypothetical protein